MTKRIQTAADLALVLEAERRKQKLTRSDLADRLGIGPSVVTRWLSNSRLTVEQAARLAGALGKVVTFRLSPRNGVSS